MHVDSTHMIVRSDGAIVALLMGIYHPVKTKKIAAFAGNVTPDAAGLFADGYAEVVADRKHADEMLAKHDTTQKLAFDTTTKSHDGIPTAHFLRRLKQDKLSCVSDVLRS